MIKESACKKCRREGEKLFLKGERCFTPKCAVTRKAYAPGQHGAFSRRRPSEYGNQLREKQKVKRIYEVRETQFRNYFKKAGKITGVTGENLLILLEKRIDSVLYRLGFADSRKAARQIVSHGHIKINDKKASIASIEVKVNDRINFTDKYQKTDNFKNIEAKAKGNKNIPDWIKLDIKTMEATIVKNPVRENIDSEINENLIVEHYSR